MKPWPAFSGCNGPPGSSGGQPPRRRHFPKNPLPSIAGREPVSDPPAYRRRYGARKGARGEQCKKVTADFAGGLLSSDGGPLLLLAAERRPGLAKSLADSIQKWQDPERTVHTLPPMQGDDMGLITHGCWSGRIDLIPPKGADMEYSPAKTEYLDQRRSKRQKEHTNNDPSVIKHKPEPEWSPFGVVIGFAVACLLVTFAVDAILG